MTDLNGILRALDMGKHFDVDSAVASGGCTIVFDKSIELTLEAPPQQPLLHVYAPILTLDKSYPREDILAALLQLHLFGAATGGAYFGLDSKLDKVIVFQTFVLDSTDEKTIVSAIENIVNQVERWRAGLPKMAEELKNRRGDNPDRHPSMSLA